MLCHEERDRKLKVPFADLVAKGIHTEEYAGAAEDYGCSKEHAFGNTRCFGIERALTLVVAHKDKAQKVDSDEEYADDL